MTVEVVIPWRPGCPHRERALTWVLDRYHRNHPDWAVTVAETTDGPWVKAAAVMPAIQRSTADRIVVADADCWSPDLNQAAASTTAWAIPHAVVKRLTEQATAHVLDGADPEQLGHDALAERPYFGVEAGGIVVVDRDVALDVPLDPRFEGWGGEDHAWGYALRSLAGAPWRGSGALWHLWHPPAPRRSRQVGAHRSEQLRRRYRDARVFETAMRAAVEEAKEALWPRCASS